MAQGEKKRMGVTVEIKPHAYDPVLNWDLFDGVLPRRLLAFAIDAAIIFAAAALATVVIVVFGFVTLGLGWWLFTLLYPGTVIWALIYYGSTLGSPASATIGMRVMDIEMRTWYGAPCYFVLGAVHAIVFYVSMTMFTPLVLIAGLFNTRQRLLHDFVVGTVVINNARRAAALRAVAAI
jgi:uncharacterized RDD family membrane protein YckC